MADKALKRSDDHVKGYFKKTITFFVMMSFLWSNMVYAGKDILPEGHEWEHPHTTIRPNTFSATQHIDALHIYESGEIIAQDLEGNRSSIKPYNQPQEVKEAIQHEHLMSLLGHFNLYVTKPGEELKIQLMGGLKGGGRWLCITCFGGTSCFPDFTDGVRKPSDRDRGGYGSDYGGGYCPDKVCNYTPEQHKALAYKYLENSIQGTSMPYNVALALKAYLLTKGLKNDVLLSPLYKFKYDFDKDVWDGDHPFKTVTYSRSTTPPNKSIETMTQKVFMEEILKALPGLKEWNAQNEYGHNIDRASVRELTDVGYIVAANLQNSSALAKNILQKIDSQVGEYIILKCGMGQDLVPRGIIGLVTRRALPKAIREAIYNTPACQALDVCKKQLEPGVQYYKNLNAAQSQQIIDVSKDIAYSQGKKPDSATINQAYNSVMDKALRAVFDYYRTKTNEKGYVDSLDIQQNVIISKALSLMKTNCKIFTQPNTIPLSAAFKEIQALGWNQEALNRYKTFTGNKGSLRYTNLNGNVAVLNLRTGLVDPIVIADAYKDGAFLPQGYKQNPEHERLGEALLRGYGHAVDALLCETIGFCDAKANPIKLAFDIAKNPIVVNWSSQGVRWLVSTIGLSASTMWNGKVKNFVTDAVDWAKRPTTILSTPIHEDIMLAFIREYGPDAIKEFRTFADEVKPKILSGEINQTQIRDIILESRKNNPSKAESPIWQGLKPLKGKYKTDDKSEKVYDWDHLHNDIEVYKNSGGKEKEHLGTMDPTSGKMIKGPVNGRKIEI